MKFIQVLFSLLSRNQKIFCIFLFFLMVLTAFVELAGVGSIFPYIKVLSAQSYIHENKVLSEIYDFFGFSSNDSFLITVGLIIFLMLVIKSFLSIANNYYQSKLTYDVNNELTGLFLSRFMNMPFDKSINLNVSVVSKHLLVDLSGVSAVLQASLLFLTDMLISLSMIALMIFIQPVLMISVMVTLGLLMILTNKLTKSRIKSLSTENEYANRQAYKTANESLSAIKDIKVYKVNNYFLDRHMKWRYQLSKQLVEFSVISNIPTTVLNLVGFGVLLAVLLILVISHGNLLSILPTIGLIALSVQRMLPSASRITTSIATIRRFLPQLNVTKKLLDDFAGSVNQKQSLAEKSEFMSSIKLVDVCYRYSPEKKLALDNISLTIKKGCSLGIVGQSGSGKSTLINLLLGLIVPESGKIYLDGKFSDAATFNSVSGIVAYVPQHVFLLDASIKDNIAFGVLSEEVDMDRLNIAIKLAQLEEMIAQLDEGINTVVGERGVLLSGGQCQRIGIARALYTDPDILILDEATNALDSATESEFNKNLQIKMSGKTIIIVAHRLTSVSFCDNIIQLESGKIIESGSYNKLLKSDNFRRIHNLSEI